MPTFKQVDGESLTQVSGGGGLLHRRGKCWVCGEGYGLGDNEYDIHMCHKCRALSKDERKSLFEDRCESFPEDEREILRKLFDISQKN